MKSIHRDWYPISNHLFRDPLKGYLQYVEEAVPKHLREDMFKFLEVSIESIKVVSIISTPKSKSSFIKDDIMYLPVKLIAGYGDDNIWEHFIRDLIKLISCKKSCIWVINKECQEYVSSINEAFIIDDYNTPHLIDHIPLAYYNYVQLYDDPMLEYKINTLLKRLNK